MVAKNQRCKKAEQSAIEMALAAIEGRPNPLDDPELRKVSPDPTSLDMPEEEYREVHSTLRHSHSHVDACAVCGSPLWDDCMDA